MTLSNIYDGAIVQNTQPLIAVIYFRQKSLIIDVFLDAIYVRKYRHSSCLQWQCIFFGKIETGFTGTGNWVKKCLLDFISSKIHLS